MQNPPFDASVQEKVERKRQREKQRRSDLATAFEQLATLIKKVDPDRPDDKSEVSTTKRGKLVGDDDQGEIQGLTRLDLIQQAIDVLHKLHRENIDLRNEMKINNGANVYNDQETIVMVPTLTAVDPGRDEPQPGGEFPPNHYPSNASYFVPSHPPFQPHPHTHQQSPHHYPHGGYWTNQYLPPPPHQHAPWVPPGNHYPPGTYYSQQFHQHNAATPRDPSLGSHTPERDFYDSRSHFHG